MKRYETSHDYLVGIKTAVVIDNKDPLCQERIKIRVLGMHDINSEDPEYYIWARHCSPFRNASGDLPQPNDIVYVMFENRSDFLSCIWLGFVKYSKYIEEETVTTNA